MTVVAFPFDRRNWVFDLDGTLTVAVHDFAAIREELGLPPGRPILEAIDELDPHVAGPLRRRLDAIEAALVARTRPASGAAALCRRLSEAGCRLGILTRNSVDNAMRTLAAAGLERWFARADVVGRDEATPKPSPDGIERLLRRWQARPDDAVIVGDYLFDLTAGRAAGVGTVYVDVDALFPFRAHADLSVPGLDALLALGDRVRGDPP